MDKLGWRLTQVNEPMSIWVRARCYNWLILIIIPLVWLLDRSTGPGLSRPGAGYPRSEGLGAKFEVYLGIATAARALRAELEDIQTQLRQHSLRDALEFLAAHWR